jgi:hypothetical protein
MEIFEATSVGQQKARAAVMVGRMNPPTAGHYKVIDTMKAFIRKNPDLKLSATPIVVIVEGEKTSQDKKHNPLTAEERTKFMSSSGRANGVVFITAPSAFAAFEEVRKSGYEPIAIAAGSDRIEKYIGLLDKYFTASDDSKIDHVAIPGLERQGQDGKENNKSKAMQAALDSLKGGTDLDISEVSGSMARRAVELGYEEEFAQIVGLGNKPKLAKMMFDKVKASLGGEDGKSTD